MVSSLWTHHRQHGRECNASNKAWNDNHTFLEIEILRSQLLSHGCETLYPNLNTHYATPYSWTLPTSFFLLMDASNDSTLACALSVQPYATRQKIPSRYQSHVDVRCILDHADSLVSYGLQESDSVVL